MHKLNPSMEYSEEEACLTALKYACGAVFPMVLTAAVELDLFELIKKAGNISASELAAQLPTTNPDAAAVLDRILRLLTANSVLTCTKQDGGSERRYGLSPVGKYFTKNEDGVSFCSSALVIQDKALMECWYQLKDTILEGGTSPFERAHGVSIYGYVAKDERVAKNLHMAMAESTLLYKKLIEMYKGFEGFQSVVDVGGGTGATLNIILSNHPSIKCINFDLPHVVQIAPPYPGVEHVGGDMFVSVPKGDAILLKRVMLNWSDAECVKILRNCKEAATEKGKVVIVDFVLPEIPQTGTAGYVEQTDLQMLAYNPGAKLRTEMEFRALAKEAGFKQFAKVCTALNMWVMELY